MTRFGKRKPQMHEQYDRNSPLPLPAQTQNFRFLKKDMLYTTKKCLLNKNAENIETLLHFCLFACFFPTENKYSFKIFQKK